MPADGLAKWASFYTGSLFHIAELINADSAALQALVDAQGTERLAANLRKRINGTLEEIRAVFTSFDREGTGLLPAKKFQAACATLGVVLSTKEQDWVRQAVSDGSGNVNWVAFCDAFDE